MERPAGSLGRAPESGYSFFEAGEHLIGAWRIQTFLLRHLIG